MKFFLIILGLFAIATAAPLAIRRVEHAALAPPAGVVGVRDIIGNTTEQHDNSTVTVVHHGIKPKTRKNVGKRQFMGTAVEQVEEELVESLVEETKNNVGKRQIQAAIEIVDLVIDLVEGIIDEINEDNTVLK